MMRNTVKDLWKLCFDDTEAFIEMYFELRYNNEVNLAIESGEEIIAALQMLPYPMTYYKKEIPTTYLSGACTHPDYRKRGVMHELLLQAFARMLHKGVALSTLIPAEPWLVEYYSRTGFAPLFLYRSELFCPASPAVAPLENTTFHATTAYEEEVYQYIYRKHKEHNACILHTESDFQVVLADLQLGKGAIYVLRREAAIVAVAIGYEQKDGPYYIEEALADTPLLKEELFGQICTCLNTNSLRIKVPAQTGEVKGMARIINAKAMLQLYAEAHPEVEMSIALNDEQLTANSGYYYLSKGKCMNSAKRLPGSHLALTIGQLTEKLFASLQPHISLMLD